MKKVTTKTYILTFFFAVLFSLTYGQEYLSKELKPIKDNFTRINAKKSWTTIDTVGLWESLEGGQVNYYYSSDTLEKIIVRNFGETYQTITEYYIQKQQLSFVLNKVYNYNRPILYDSLVMKENNDNQVWDFNKSKIEETRSYFKNGKMIHQINNQDCGSPFSNEYLMKEGRAILIEFEKYRILGNKKKK